MDHVRVFQKWISWSSPIPVCITLACECVHATADGQPLCRSESTSDAAPRALGCPRLAPSARAVRCVHADDDAAGNDARREQCATRRGLHHGGPRRARGWRRGLLVLGRVGDGVGERGRVHGGVRLIARQGGSRITATGYDTLLDAAVKYADARANAQLLARYGVRASASACTLRQTLSGAGPGVPSRGRGRAAPAGVAHGPALQFSPHRVQFSAVRGAAGAGGLGGVCVSVSLCVSVCLCPCVFACV